MGRRGQGQDRRSPGRARRHGHALPGRQQRRPHDRARRAEVGLPPHPERDPLPRQAVRHRQRRRGRPARAQRRDRRAAGQGRRRLGAARQRQRAPDHALPPDARLGRRGQARQALDRDDEARHRAVLRRQGGAPGHPRAGHARREDPQEEDRRRARAQAPDPAPVRQGPRARPAAHDRGLPDLRPPHRAVHRRHLRARAALPGRRRHGRLRGRPGDDARPRPRHLSLRHLVEPDRRRGLRGRGRRPARHRRHLGRRQGLRHARGRRARSRPSSTTRSAPTSASAAASSAPPPGARGAPAGWTSSPCATPRA